MNTLAIYCILQLVFTASDDAQIARAIYRYPWGRVVVSFDPHRTPKAELDRWMRLSPSLSPYNSLFVPISIRQCISHKDGYEGCEEKGVLRISNVDINLQKIRTLKSELDHEKLPTDLKPISDYLSEIQNFTLWSMERQRDFLVTNDIASLEKEYDDLSTKESCAPIVQRIAKTPEPRRTDLLTVDWANCVWFSEAKKTGPYPKQKWDDFLRSQSITEIIQEEVPKEN